MELVPGDVTADCIAFTAVYEPALSRWAAQLTRAGGTLVDVGVNLGSYALLWLGATVLCIGWEMSRR